MAMKMTAPRSGWPTREIALLIAEPSPALRVGIELISVLVRGATTHAMPTPKIRAKGRKSMRYPLEGRRVDGLSAWASQGVDDDGMRASQSDATAMRMGPIVRKTRLPRRPASVPTRVDKNVRHRPTGSPAIPAAKA